MSSRYCSHLTQFRSRSGKFGESTDIKHLVILILVDTTQALSQDYDILLWCPNERSMSENTI